MTIEDVLSPDTCVCRTDEGRILEGKSKPWQLGISHLKGQEPGPGTEHDMLS
jgi:hypothetical protein